MVIYLLVSIACDAALVGTWVYPDMSISVGLPAISKLCLKFVLLVAESQGKGGILRGARGHWPPEQLAGILNTTFFWWINPILAQGSRDILTGENLPSIDHELSSKLLRHRALIAWDQRGRLFREYDKFSLTSACEAKPETTTTLPKVLVRSMLPAFLAPIIPRLLLIVFCYAQPVLISTAIRHIRKPPGEDSKAGYEVILMAIAVYMGLTVNSPGF